jgi:hypothetical protein
LLGGNTIHGSIFTLIFTLNQGIAKADVGIYPLIPSLSSGAAFTTRHRR